MATLSLVTSRIPGEMVSALIRTYRFIASPFPSRCRYSPSCSTYALEAVQRYGAMKGSWLAIRRIGRCHPFGGSGYDPVP